MRVIRSIASLTLFAASVLIASCSRTPPENTALASFNAALPPAETSSWVADKIWDEPHGSRGAEFKSSEEALRVLRLEERRLVEAFYDQFGSSVFDFKTESQFEWMVRNGYPTPADVLLAASMSTDELLRQFEAGDLKSGYFYLARKSSQNRPADLSTNERQHLDRVARRLLEGGSPFAGYSYFHYQMNLKNDPLSAFAGLAWADTAGDSRAGLEVAEMANQIETLHPGSIPPGSILISYKALLSTIAVRNRALLARQWEPYPFGDQ